MRPRNRERPQPEQPGTPPEIAPLSPAPIPAPAPAPPAHKADPLEVFTRAGVPLPNGGGFEGLWMGCAGFLVCGGPSLKQLPIERLKDRGIASLGINNVAGYAHTRAMVFSDPPAKFHHGIWFDPSILKLVPLPKLARSDSEHQIRAKIDGRFHATGYRPKDCPAVLGFKRAEDLQVDKFLTNPGAYWGVNQACHEATGKPKILFTFFLGLRLLHFLGVRRIYLLGCDFTMSPENKYAFGQGRTSRAIAGNNNIYRTANMYCGQLRPILEKAGLEVYNCNPDSGLAAWDYVPFAEAYQDCRGLVPDEPFSMSGWYEKFKLGKTNKRGKQVSEMIPNGVDVEQWLRDHLESVDE